MEKKLRWASKEECRKYLAQHKPTGLTLCAAADFLGSKTRGWYDESRGVKKKDKKEGKEANA